MMDRRRIVAVVSLLGVFVLAGTLTGPAGAASWRSFEVLAGGDGLRAIGSVPGSPLQDQALDLGLPTVQARLDNLGSSTAYSAAPFPGDLALSAIGIASGVAKTQLPAYPFIARTSHPTQKESTVTAGPFALSASSERDSSKASAASGPAGVSPSKANASVERSADDALVASARSELASIELGPVVVGRVVATARAERTPDGDLERGSSLAVTGLEVAGQHVPVPIPDSKAILDLLEDNDVSIRYLKERTTPSGVVSPSVEITLYGDVALTSGGTSSVTLSLGRAWVSLDARTESANTTDEEDPVPPVTFDPPLQPIGNSFVPPAPSDTVNPPTVSGPPATPTVPALRPVAVERLPDGIFLLIIVPAALAAALASMMSRWGVRRVWS